MVVDENFTYVSGRTEADRALIGMKALIVKFYKATGDILDHRAWGGLIFNDGLGMTSDGSALYMVGLKLGSGNGGSEFPPQIR